MLNLDTVSSLNLYHYLFTFINE